MVVEVGAGEGVGVATQPARYERMSGMDRTVDVMLVQATRGDPGARHVVAKELARLRRIEARAQEIAQFQLPYEHVDYARASTEADLARQILDDSDVPS